MLKLDFPTINLLNFSHIIWQVYITIQEADFPIYFFTETFWQPTTSTQDIVSLSAEPGLPISIFLS